MRQRSKLDNILFATDLSGESAHTIAWLRWFCDYHHSRAYIVHVLDVFPLGLSAEEMARRRSEAGRRLDRFIQRNRLDRKTFKPMLVVGDIAVTVTEFVRKHAVALIILGSRAVGLDRLVRGSISEEVFRSTDCPVVTIGPRARAPRTAVRVRHVLFASNMVKQSRLVLPRLKFLFLGNARSDLVLAHFLPKESKSLVQRHRIRKELHARLIELVPSRLRDHISDVVVESGPPVKGILEFSKYVRADLTVLAVRDAGPFTRAATHRLGFITPQIIRSATCPVLTIRV